MMNRRCVVRYRLGTEAVERTVRDEQGDCLPARVVDLSVRGLALCVNRRFELGDLLTVEWPGKDGETRYFLLRVKSIERQSSDTWRVGGLFSRSLTDLELITLL